MRTETLEILEMFKEDKITAEEATKLFEDPAGNDKLKTRESWKKAPTGINHWINRILFGFIPMLILFGIAITLIYAFIFYLPVHLPQETLIALYGTIGGIIISLII